MPHEIAIAAFDGVVPFDLSVPFEVFGRARAPYRVRVCAATRTVDAGAFEMRVPFGLRALAKADTVIVPGIADVSRAVPSALLAAIRRAAARGARIVSICSGTFVLAQTGLLDGLRATTHWLGCEALARMHPAIEVDPGVLYVDNGQILTSAGAAAGLDLCLHLVRRDHGAAIAADVARLSVYPLEREGGQAQFIARPALPADGGSLEPVLAFIDAHLARPWSIEAIARRAGTSPRTLARRFRAETGGTPAQWITARRVRRAQELLETTARSIERIADDCGFGSTASLRDRFRRIVGASPAAYRAAFRAPARAPRSPVARRSRGTPSRGSRPSAGTRPAR